MDRRQFIVGSMAAVAAASALQARAAEPVEPDCDHPDPPCPPHHHRLGIVGSWAGILQPLDDIRTFNDLMSFTPGGVVMESCRTSIRELPAGRMYATAGHGAWKAIDDNTVEVRYRVLLQQVQTGDQYGTEEVTMKIDIKDHNTLSGTFAGEVRDLSGAIVLAARGTYGATRIKP